MRFVLFLPGLTRVRGLDKLHSCSVLLVGVVLLGSGSCCCARLAACRTPCCSHSGPSHDRHPITAGNSIHCLLLLSL